MNFLERNVVWSTSASWQICARRLWAATPHLTRAIIRHDPFSDFPRTNHCCPSIIHSSRACNISVCYNYVVPASQKNKFRVNLIHRCYGLLISYQVTVNWWHNWDIIESELGMESNSFLSKSFGCMTFVHIYKWIVTIYWKRRIELIFFDLIVRCCIFIYSAFAVDLQIDSSVLIDWFSLHFQFVRFMLDYYANLWCCIPV